MEESQRKEDLKEAQAGNGIERAILVPKNYDPVHLIRKENYQLSTSLGWTFSEVYPIKAVIDTGSGRNTPHTSVMSLICRQHLNSPPEPKITDASELRMKLIGRVTLLTRMVSLNARITYELASSLPVHCISGTSFVDRYVGAIIPRTAEVFLEGGAEVALIARGVKDEKQPSSGEEPMKEEGGDVQLG